MENFKKEQQTIRIKKSTYLLIYKIKSEAKQKGQNLTFDEIIKSALEKPKFKITDEEWSNIKKRLEIGEFQGDLKSES